MVREMFVGWNNCNEKSAAYIQVSNLLTYLSLTAGLLAVLAGAQHAGALPGADRAGGNRGYL